MAKERKVWVTVYQPIAGWKAVLCDDEGPIQTGYFAYATKAEAIADAKVWADAEEIPFDENGGLGRYHG